MSGRADLLHGQWEPATPGEWVDLLIVRNLRMWHLQERVYDPANLLAQDREGLVAYLQDATWMNLQRNEAMDRLDASLHALLFGETRGAAPAAAPDPTLIWSPTLADEDPLP